MTAPDLDTSRAQLLVVLADDALVTGHRAAHWTGVAPSLEEDLAFSTLAQDAINHADVWYQVLLGPAVTGPAQRAAVDALGLGRPPEAYRHAVVCERPPGDFVTTLARHWAWERFDAMRLAALLDSRDAEVAAVARRLVLEQRYHLAHADQWFARLTAHPDGAGRFRAALAAVLPEALGLAEAFPTEPDAVACGLLPVPHATLGDRWCEQLAATLGPLGWEDLVPTAVPAAASGGREGRHSTDFTADVWPEMTALYRAHPGASW